MCQILYNALKTSVRLWMLVVVQSWSWLLLAVAPGGLLIYLWPGLPWQHSVHTFSLASKLMLSYFLIPSEGFLCSCTIFVRWIDCLKMHARLFCYITRRLIHVVLEFEGCCSRPVALCCSQTSSIMQTLFGCLLVDCKFVCMHLISPISECFFTLAYARHYVLGL